jgi:hypothetical protein
MIQMPNTQKVNPLSNYFRQPKIFIRLPSNGSWYPPGALDKSETSEYAVFAMTAKDELMFKTPDALLSGQSTVEVIKSCIPSIKDPWAMPSLDVDATLIAIRIATYGEKMEVSTNCPHCNADNEYEIDLLNWLSTITGFQYNPEVKVSELTVHIRPYNYRELSQTSLKTLEQQRIFSVINSEEMSDELKIQKFGESFVKLTELTVDIIANCIARIDTPTGSVDDPAFIKEFINNAPKDVFEILSNHVAEMKRKIEIPVQHVACNDCKEEFDMPVTMDQSNFFAARS